METGETQVRCKCCNKLFYVHADMSQLLNYGGHFACAYCEEVMVINIHNGCLQSLKEFREWYDFFVKGR